MSSGAGTLGKYQIIREIARSNDIVYEAYDPAMNRRVAVKELAVPHGATEKQRAERLARFQREAKAAGSLTHPNIVTIYEVGEDNGRAYIAMEYLEGQNLRQRMDAEGALSQDEAVRIICEVLEGLSYAHERGVVHRDIKPDNVQLLPDGRVKITDFGIARLMFEPSLTMDGQIFGTPSYMSPEQVVGREIDVRTDIWSCGVLLYESIAGTKPFSGDSVVSISHGIMHIDPPDPPGASFPVAQVIRRAIDKAPAQRYSGAKVMVKALREALESHQQEAAPTPTYPSPWGPPLDPYSSQPPPQQPQPVGGVPPVYTSPGSVYGQPYGQPYVYGSGNTPPPPVATPYPPAWVNPPKSSPLISPAVSDFLRRTMLVVIVGGILLAVGILALGALTRAADERIFAPQTAARSESRYEEAIELRRRALASSLLTERVSLLDQSVLLLEDAARNAPDDRRVEYHEQWATGHVLLAQEFRSFGELEQAQRHLQRAIHYSDSFGNSDAGNTARALLRETGGFIR